MDREGGEAAARRVVPMPNVYRGLHREADSGPRYAQYVAAAADGAAAFFCESALSCAGQVMLPRVSAGSLSRGSRGWWRVCGGRSTDRASDAPARISGCSRRRAWCPTL